MSYQDYNQPGYGQQSSSMAVISLIAGIASFFIVPLLGAIAAVITGGMAKKEIRQSGGRITGLGMANWGVALGWINIGFSVIGLCLGVLALTGAIGLPVCLMPFSNSFSY
ncbi:MAG: DUF4190 domain-containing protein [Anaerolineaceae bacterium]|jgi:hypothetical protein|nr:DUF4190 domain-containing protein [Anaerolineaceae bacterium]